MGDGPVETRAARPDEFPLVMGILDGAMLEIDAGQVRSRIDDGRVSVATVDGRLLGAVVWKPRGDGGYVEAIAVRPRCRGRGIGTALVEAVAADATPITAEFDASTRPFYAAIGFEIEAIEQDRFCGMWRP